MTRRKSTLPSPCACGCGTPVYGRFAPRHGARVQPHGDKASRWNGGKCLSPRGYVLIFNEEWRTNGRPKYIQEHRLVMEKALGHPLLPGEICHHINGEKTDNRPENLAIMRQGEHARLHIAINRWSRKHNACVECGTTDRPHAKGGRCRLCHARWTRRPAFFSKRVTGRWANLYDACVRCGTTERRHLCHGLCAQCHERQRVRHGGAPK
jgi:hypothetical protein